MTDKVNGKLEACSFKKKVVKVNGKWYRFEENHRDFISDIDVGEDVELTTEGDKITFVKAVQTMPQQQPMATRQISPGKEDSIAKMSALKSACELAQSVEFKSTREILTVASSFYSWLSEGTINDIALSNQKRRSVVTRGREEQGAAAPPAASSPANPDDMIVGRGRPSPLGSNR